MSNKQNILSAIQDVRNLLQGTSDQILSSVFKTAISEGMKHPETSELFTTIDKHLRAIHEGMLGQMHNQTTTAIDHHIANLYKASIEKAIERCDLDKPEDRDSLHLILKGAGLGIAAICGRMPS